MTTPSAVRCECGAPGHVIDSRERSAGYVFRRRHCGLCGARWTTREVRVDGIPAQSARFRFDVVLNPSLPSDVVELRDPQTGALLVRLQGVIEP